MSRLFTTYEEPLKDRTFTEEQMQEVYRDLADKTEYPDFETWLQDMLKSGVFEETTEEFSPLKQIVDYMIKSGTEWTETGAYIFYHDELAKAFTLPVDWFRENHEAIKEEIDSRKEVLSETWDELDALGNPEGFDINFCLKYCNIDEEI